MDTPSLKIRTFKMDGNTVHLIGAMHGNMFFGKLAGGLTEDEKEKIRDHFRKNSLGSENTIILAEGSKKKAFDTWLKSAGLDLEPFENKTLAETKKTMHTTFTRPMAKSVKRFAKKPLSTKAKYIAGATVLIPIAGTVFMFREISAISSKRIRDHYRAQMDLRIKASLKNQSPAQEKRNSRGLSFRDFVQATSIKTAAQLTKNTNIVLLQGVFHTSGVERFLKDKSYYERYQRHLAALAPRANRMHLENLERRRRELTAKEAKKAQRQELERIRRV